MFLCRQLAADRIRAEDTRRVLVILCHKVERRRNTLVGERLNDRRRDYLRSFCRALWSATVVSVRQNSPLKDNRTLQLALNAYIQLGKLLGMGSPAKISPYPGVGPETPFRVCHWRGCLCSVFKPSHSLKKCNGCEKALYCNDKCQARSVLIVIRFCADIDVDLSDWDEGGHQVACRLFRARSVIRSVSQPNYSDVDYSSGVILSIMTRRATSFTVLAHIMSSQSHTSVKISRRL